ncbi:hypothetical protein Pyn_10457 [Prunus yedoensis var. nudiflora]|uniref:Uncharacterized protein n=1 Tax=Prunus yedoensis var. nudiflora TaxID=2094558 RepID=A0A315B348_PRUYE|nr:hypothetical protein Pyn_10457 [Prunus yedoensis var. nudiflora]
MNPSHVIYGTCTRDCGVKGYGGPQGPRKLLDSGGFGLTTWSTKVQTHYFDFPMWRAFPFYKLGGIAQAKPTSLGCCKPPSNYENSLSLAAASIPIAINSLLQPSALPLAAGAAQQLLALAAASILAAINPLLQ